MNNDMFNNNFENNGNGYNQNNQNNNYNGSYNFSQNPDPQVHVQEYVPKRKRRVAAGFMKIIVFALVFGIATGGTYFAANQAFNGGVKNTPAAATIQTGSLLSANTVQATTHTDVSGVVEQAMPSIVSINVKSTVVNSIFGRAFQQEQEGSGSGIIISQNNQEVLIATNNHVVSNADKVIIEFVDGTSAEAQVKGTDPSNDLAVVAVDFSKLSDATKSKIKVAALGDSDKAKAGEMVIAIGNALGYGQSVTVGYISALDRKVQTEDYTMTLLQTDAAINPGNSGGALLNANGQVIGINSVKYSSTGVEGMGYAIPISKAIPIINDLMNKEEVPEKDQAYLGIMGQDVTEEISQSYGLPVGVYISEVTKGSPAEAYGLQARDIIVGINGKTITSMEQLKSQLVSLRAGTEATITVKRANGNNFQELEVKVKLGSNPQYQAR